MSAGVWMRASACVERRGAGARGAAGPDALPGGRGRCRQGGVVPRDSAHGSPTCSGAKGRKRCACVSKHTRTVEGNHVSLISAVAPGMKGVSCGTSVFATLLEVFQDCIHVREDIYSI